ncbi:hypothetical protein PN483_22190 [Nodularia spumigena CS-591/04]|uniref:TRADD-N-associated membrane domain-containing protein n=1 Tax=Nodularia spumigena TaxID=70799 RepID=UPI00232E557F|nr:hypothetical protein [Nodularia spumigena]MDB9321772.1 hypothetical protein [Nodularia spumigena CS-591/07A]MDB9333163.1 hypothetical protein [Nodularia spumigena CS-591/04]MDB9358832.1 hypothetical protein [Nodularia spumigena CS-588/02]MDB9364142.1 hypothetical protein [Nodularia spumigena CS-588/02A10]
MSKNIMLSQPSPESNPLLTARLSIVQERIRQARYSFNFALIATALSFGISLVGAGYLISNKASEGAITTAIGLVASMRYMQIAKDANNRLDKIADDLDTE